MSIEAMKLALEALENVYGKGKRCYAAITALRQAIEQVEQAPICAHGVSKLKCDFCKRPEQAQPVAWRTFDGEGGYDYRDYHMNEDYAQEWAKRNPLHVGWVEPLYTTPPQRQHWVSLTDKQLEEMAEKYVTNCYFDTLKYARAVEAELKEKNFVPSKLEAD
jgi:hypothetical protein